MRQSSYGYCTGKSDEGINKFNKSNGNTHVKIFTPTGHEYHGTGIPELQFHAAKNSRYT
jgi:hypothetical protein